MDTIQILGYILYGLFFIALPIVLVLFFYIAIAEFIADIRFINKQKRFKNC
jgi:hypothetical protein